MKVLGISGSLRKGSYNTKLLMLAKGFALEAGTDAEILDLNEINLPVYNYDIEAAGMPENVLKFKAKIESTDVLLIASPENNYSITTALKNAIDWGSRGKPNSWGGKIAAIFGASTGPMGTVRGQNQLRQILAGVNVLVLPQPQVFVANAETAFNEDGTLKNKTQEEQLKKLVLKTMKLANWKDLISL